jgi:hypothetical protein
MDHFTSGRLSVVVVGTQQLVSTENRVGSDTAYLSYNVLYGGRPLAKLAVEFSGEEPTINQNCEAMIQGRSRLRPFVAQSPMLFDM